MKPHKKQPLISPEVPRTKGRLKKAPKPWELERKFNSKEEYLKTFEGQYRPNNYVDGWIENHHYKFMSPEHAIQQLSKQHRSWYNRLQGSSWRIINKETGEVLYLKSTNANSLYFVEDK